VSSVFSVVGPSLSWSQSGHGIDSPGLADPGRRKLGLGEPRKTRNTRKEDSIFGFRTEDCFVESAMPMLLHEDETYRIRGACFEVYKEKGCGFLEAVYQECLEIELSLRIPGDSQFWPEAHDLRISTKNHLSTFLLNARLNSRALHMFWANQPGPSTSTTAPPGLFGSCRFGMTSRKTSCANF